MAYKNFYISVIIRILLILATCIWFAEAIRNPRNIYTLTVVSGLVILQVISLINSINRVNRSISTFFDGIHEIGSSVRPHFRVENASFRDLSRAIGRVAGIIEEARKVNEKQLQYFRFVIGNIPAGLIVVDWDGKINEVNRSARTILKVDNLSKLSDLGTKYAAMQEEIHRFEPGYAKTMKLKINNSFEYINLRIAGFRSENENLKIITLQNITNEMEENELISWQKLTRVLTHEIMNSLTPISSLTEAARRCLNSPEIEKIEGKHQVERIRDALLNLDLIDERNASVRNFVSSYKRVSQVPALNLVRMNISDIVENNIMAMKSELEHKNIKVIKEYEDCPDTDLDEKLVGQVITNLVKNAVEAMTNVRKKILTLRTYTQYGRISIDIADSGKGIPDDEIENIFTPFFTTKKEGMGIGLSLSRQIMRLHKGNIKVISCPGERTTFTLTF